VLWVLSRIGGIRIKRTFANLGIDGTGFERKVETPSDQLERMLNPDPEGNKNLFES